MSRLNRCKGRNTLGERVGN